MNNRILHIVSGDLWGGAEAQVLLQSKALLKAGWDIQALLFNQKETFDRYSAAGLPCRHLPERRGLPVIGPRLFNAVRTLKPDLLVAHGYKESIAACTASLVCRVPWISTFHGLGENYRGFARLKSAVYIAVYRFLSRQHAAKVVAVSRALANELGFSGQSHLEIVHNVAEPPVADVERERLAQNGGWAAVVVGRLAPVKRVDLALHAFAHVAAQPQGSNGSLFIIGDGPERSSLERLCAALSLSGQVHFLGFRDDADRLIGQADLLLITSDSEGIPTVLLEAAARGIPAVATDVGGICEVLDKLPEYPAVLVPKGEAAELARAIILLAGKQLNPAQKQSVHEAFLRHFSPAVAANRLSEIYRSVIQAHVNKEEHV